MTDAVAGLIALISSAFGETPHVVRQALVYPGAWETASLIQSLAAVNDLPTDAFIEAHADSLAEFTPEGLRHVLPYYLRYSLKNPESESGVTVTEDLLFHLSPSDPESEYWRPRIEALSPAQKQAVCAYFKHMQATSARKDLYEEAFTRGFAAWACQ